jgi:hypothetical protein
MKVSIFLKCHDIFRLRLFHQTTSPGPCRHAPKQYRIFLIIRGVIRIRSHLPDPRFFKE